MAIDVTKILLIAPLGSGTSAANVIGGNRVLAEKLVYELGQRGFELEALDTSGSVTNRPRWIIQAVRLARYLRVMWGLVRRLRRSQIVFLFIASWSATVLASSVWALCKLARRPMVLRFSGANFSQVYRNFGALARRLADRTYLHSALVYVETLELIRNFENPANFRWFPCSRDIEAPPTVRREIPDRLIFVARLDMDKGLAEALEACRNLPGDCHLNVYGPRVSDTDLSLFEGHPQASYGGVLKPEEVPRTMVEHDLLIYPSYFRAEGYAAVIVEAFQCGLPVVAAKWGGVPELVGHEENGLLVEPRSAAAVQAAIERLREDPALYRRLCEGARRRGEDFRSAHWFESIAADLRALCRM